MAEPWRAEQLKGCDTGGGRKGPGTRKVKVEPWMSENPTENEGRGLMVVVGTDGGGKKKGAVLQDFEGGVDVRSTFQLLPRRFFPPSHTFPPIKSNKFYFLQIVCVLYLESLKSVLL